MKKQYFRFLTILTLTSVGAGCADRQEEPKPPANTYEPCFIGIIENFNNRWNGSGSTPADTLCIYAVNEENAIVARQYYIPEESAAESRLIPVDQQPMTLSEDQKYRFYSCRKTYIPVQGPEGISSGLNNSQYQQKGNDSIYHRNYDFIYAKAETSDRQIRFTYKHIYARLEFELPAGVKAIVLQAADPNEEYVGRRIFSFKTDDWSHYTVGLPMVNLQLGEPTAKDREKAWMLVYPGHENKPFDLIVQTADYKIYRIPYTAPDNGYQSGQTYTLKVDLQEARQILQPPANDGTYWQIATADNLQWFRDNVNSGAIHLDAILTADIDLQGSAQNVWWPIGATNPYIGHFNGNGHHISSIYINNIKNNTGLWSEIDTPGCIENLELAGEIVADYNLLSGSVGGIVGSFAGGTIRRCRSGVDIIVINCKAVGGICGNSWGSISDCYYDGLIRVDGTSFSVGTILGGNLGLVENCYTTGALYYTSIITGGICGNNYAEGEIRGCVALCRHWQCTGIHYRTGGRISACNGGKSHHNMALIDLNIGASFSSDESLHGISRSREECFSPQLYRDELGWSPQIWRFNENSLPTLKIFE